MLGIEFNEYSEENLFIAYNKLTKKMKIVFNPFLNTQNSNLRKLWISRNKSKLV